MCIRFEGFVGSDHARLPPPGLTPGRLQEDSSIRLLFTHTETGIGTIRKFKQLKTGHIQKLFVSGHDKLIQKLRPRSECFVFES